MAFRVGSKVGFTMYWSDPTGDRFLGVAMTLEAAQAACDALNATFDPVRQRDVILGLPPVPPTS